MDGRRHNKGCNCKRSGCLKNYCECYEAKILCSHICKCIGCKNYEESPDHDRKMCPTLVDSVEGRSSHHHGASHRTSSKAHDTRARKEEVAEER